MPPRARKNTTLVSSQPATSTTPVKRAMAASPEPDKSRSPTKRVKTSGNTSSTTPSVTIPSPNLSGKFDIYSMKLSFLSDVYVNKNGPPRFEALHQKILSHQERDDRCAEIELAPPDKRFETSLFEDSSMYDPFTESAYTIVVDNIQHYDELSMPTLQFSSGVPADTCGITAQLTLEDGGCGISHSEGTFYLRRAWAKVDEDGKLRELYEGHVSFETFHSVLYSRKGFGDGGLWEYSFWAVRALADEDEENEWGNMTIQEVIEAKAKAIRSKYKNEDDYIRYLLQKYGRSKEDVMREEDEEEEL